jgi:hypothetical protein
MRAAARAMWDYLHGFAREDVAWDEKVAKEMAGHPCADLHAFVGFPAIRRLEDEFLPRDELDAKYDGSIGFKP